MKKYVRLLLIVWIVILGGLIYIASFIPSDKEIKSCMITKMYHVDLCPGSPRYVPLKQISPFAQKALIAAEDSNFFNHGGFDWNAIQDSAEKNLAAGKFLRGGSTISQQLAKNLFLSEEKTLMRKGLEALITFKIENTLKKNEILERYFNVVKFGKNLYGIKNASQFYFKKLPSQLDLIESAFLIMLLPSPEKYSKSFFKHTPTPFVVKRITRIVSDLYRFNRISLDDYFDAQTNLPNLFSGQRVRVEHSAEDVARAKALQKRGKAALEADDSEDDDSETDVANSSDDDDSDSDSDDNDSADVDADDEAQ